jgi:hypothetical protein
VSIGELVDKVTILRIKRRRIVDATKLQNIRHELMALEAVCDLNRIDLAGTLVSRLEAINEELWKVEDDIRDKERHKAFDAQFIELARAVYRINDKRFAVKSEINEMYGSAIKEEKSYQDYQ